MLLGCSGEESTRKLLLLPERTSVLRILYKSRNKHPNNIKSTYTTNAKANNVLGHTHSLESESPPLLSSGPHQIRRTTAHFPPSILPSEIPSNHHRSRTAPCLLFLTHPLASSQPALLYLIEIRTPKLAVTSRSRCTEFWEVLRSIWKCTKTVHRGVGNHLHFLLRRGGHLEDRSLFECRRAFYDLNEANRVHTLRGTTTHSFLLPIPLHLPQFLLPTLYTIPAQLHFPIYID